MPTQARPPRVLVAEDDPAIRRLLGMTLRRRRMEVYLASDGEEAIDALERERWDAVVTDLMMPKVNGWQVVGWLAEHPEHRPASVIVVSATNREALRDLDPTVVNAIFFKPFDVLQLGAYVKHATQQDGGDRRRARVVQSV